MNCEILETLYLRNNGDVPCNDDAGEAVLLGLIRAPFERSSMAALLFNHRYRHIRESLQRGSAPWPDVCRQCAFFRPRQPFSDPLEQRRLRKIQVEPSLACQLRCPGCSNGAQVRVRPGPHFMDLALFESVLRHLLDEGFTVGEIEYCGQGEPLLHPRFREFVQLGAGLFPAARQRLITSGNFDFDATVGDRPPSEIVVSCDGAFPESYARYRIGGEVARPLQFMRDALAGLPERRPRLIWKYILFEWNDGEDELRMADALARDLGVDWLLFVHTHSAGKSRRHTPQNAADFPVRGPHIVLNATPIHYRDAASTSDVAGLVTDPALRG